MGVLENLRRYLAKMNPDEATKIITAVRAAFAAGYGLYKQEIDPLTATTTIQKVMKISTTSYEDLKAMADEIEDKVDPDFIDYIGSEYSKEWVEKYGDFPKVPAVSGKGVYYPAHNKGGTMTVALFKHKSGEVEIKYAHIVTKTGKFVIGKLPDSCEDYPAHAVFATYFEGVNFYETPKEAYEAAGKTPPEDVDYFAPPLMRSFRHVWWWKLNSECKIVSPAPITVKKRSTKKKKSAPPAPTSTTSAPKPAPTHVAGVENPLLDVTKVKFLEDIPFVASAKDTQDFVYLLAGVMANHPAELAKRVADFLLGSLPATLEKKTLNEVSKKFLVDILTAKKTNKVGFSTLIPAPKKEIIVTADKTDVHYFVPEGAERLLFIYVRGEGNKIAIYSDVVDTASMPEEIALKKDAEFKYSTPVTAFDEYYTIALNSKGWGSPAPTPSKEEKKEEKKVEEKKVAAKRKEEAKKKKGKKPALSKMRIEIKDVTKLDREFAYRGYFIESQEGKKEFKLREGGSTITPERLRKLFNILLNNFAFREQDDAIVYLASWLTKDARVLLKGVPASGKTTLIESSVLLFANPFDISVFDNTQKYKDIIDAVTGNLFGIAVYNLDKTPAEVLYYTTIDMKVREVPTKAAKNPKWKEFGELVAWRRYEFTPQAREIVKCPIHFHNEANRMKRDVQDAVLSLMEEGRVEYMGKVIYAPPYNLHFFDYNPHLEPRYPLDWAFLDRINMSIYMPQLDLGSQYEIMKGMERGQVRVQQLVYDDLKKAVKDGVMPLSFTELVQLQNVIQREVKLSDEEYLLIQTLVNFFSISPHTYSDWYLDFQNKIEYLDLSMNSYGTRAMRGGGTKNLDVSGQTAWHILEQTYRPVGFRAYKSMVSFYKTVKFIFEGVFGIEKEPEEIAMMLLPYAIEHRISQAVGDDIKEGFLNYADVIKHNLTTKGGYIRQSIDTWKNYIEKYLSVVADIASYPSKEDAEATFLKKLGKDESAYATDPVLYQFGRSVRIQWVRYHNILSL